MKVDIYRVEYSYREPNKTWRANGLCNVAAKSIESALEVAKSHIEEPERIDLKIWSARKITELDLIEDGCIQLETERGGE